MNTILDYVTSLSTHPGVLALGWTLLHFIWQAILIAVLLACVWRAMAGASANARYLAGIAGLVLIAIAPVATWGWLHSTGNFPAALSWSGADEDARSRAPMDDLRQLQETIAQAVAGQSQANPAEGLPERQQIHSSHGSDAAAADHWVSTQDRHDDDRAVGTSGFSNGLGTWGKSWATQLSLLQRWLPLLVVCWSCGVGLFAIRMLVGLRRVAWWCREAKVSVQPHVVQIIERLQVQLQMRVAIRVLDSARIAVPAVIGVIRPAILLPTSMVSGLTTRELELILAHELAHIRRHDWTVNLLQSFVEVIWFYHPAVWWISQRIRIEREHCCDDLAVAICGDPLAYARALSRMEQMRCEPSPWAMAANGGSLLARIQRLLTPRPKNSSASLIAAWLSLLCMVAISWGIVSAGQSAQQQLARLNPELNATVAAEWVEPDRQIARNDDGPIAMVKYEKELVDSKTNRTARVFTDINLQSADGQRRSTVGLKYSSVFSYTLIPARVAAELQAVTLGEIDFGTERPIPARPRVQVDWLDPKVLARNPATDERNSVPNPPQPKSEFYVDEVTEPLGPNQRFLPFPNDTIWLPDHLGFYDMNQMQQRRFQVVRIERVDLGIGKPFGPINALVVDDANSDFGVLGNDWARAVRGPANEVLCFAAAEAAWFLLPPPELSAQQDSSVPPPTAAIQSGGSMSVSSENARPHSNFAVQAGLTRLQALTYPRDKRSSTQYVAVDQQSYPVDRGLSHNGIWYGLTLMHDLVAVDVTTGKGKWIAPWQKTQPFWEHLAIVSFQQADGSVLQAVELAAVTDDQGQVAYRFHDLLTGKRLDPDPLAWLKTDPFAATANASANASTNASTNERPLQIIRTDNGLPREVSIPAPAVFNPFNLLLESAAAAGQADRRPGELQITAPLVSVERGRIVGQAVDAEKIKFHLPAGSNITARLEGNPIGITFGNDETQLQLTRGRIELLDDQQRVRAWASADGGAEWLNVRYVLENGVPTLELTAARAVRRQSATELVQCVVTVEPSPAAAVVPSLIDSQHYRLDVNTETSEFRLNWIVAPNVEAVLDALENEEAQAVAPGPVRSCWLEIGRLKHVNFEAPYLSFQGERAISLAEVGREVELWRQKQAPSDGKMSEQVAVDIRVKDQIPPAWVLDLVRHLREVQIKRIRLHVEPSAQRLEEGRPQGTSLTLSEYLRQATFAGPSQSRNAAPANPERAVEASPMTPPATDPTNAPVQTTEPPPASNEKDETEGWGSLAEHSGLRSRITLQTEEPQVGKPLRLKLEVKNFGQRPTTIDPQNYAPFRVLRVETEGNPQRSAPFIGSRPQTSAETLTLAPGQSQTLWEDFDLTNLFLVTQPQPYVIYAEGGEWAAQTWWRDSNRLVVTLAPGELTTDQRLLAALLNQLPPEWEITQLYGDIVLSHSPTNLKSDVASYQLFFRQGADLKPLLDLLSQQDQPIIRLGATARGEAILSHTQSALEQWPQAETLIRDVLQEVLPDRQPPAMPSDSDAKSTPPWRATGRVVDAAGNPMAGVQVRAHTGIGSLRQTGKTQTDEQGNYVLDFGPGFFTADQNHVEAATISVSHPGYSEMQLGQQGDLLAAWRPVDDVRWGDKDQDDLILPGQPREVNFQLEPAVTLQGQIIVAADGQPAAGVIVSLTGKRLPPSSSVLATTKTDAAGRFVLADIPPHVAFQLVVESPRDASAPWVLATPALTFQSATAPFRTGLSTVDAEKKPQWEFDDIEIVLHEFEDHGRNALEFGLEQSLRIAGLTETFDGTHRTSRFRILLGKVGQ